MDTITRNQIKALMIDAKFERMYLRGAQIRLEDQRREAPTADHTSLEMGVQAHQERLEMIERDCAALKALIKGR